MCFLHVQRFRDQLGLFLIRNNLHLPLRLSNARNPIALTRFVQIFSPTTHSETTICHVMLPRADLDACYALCCSGLFGIFPNSVKPSPIRPANHLFTVIQSPSTNHLMHWTVHLFDYRISHVLSSGRGCSTLFLCAMDKFRCISYICSTSLSSQFDSLFASHLRPSIPIYDLCGLVRFLPPPQYLSARIRPLTSFNHQMLNIYSLLPPSLPSTT